MAEAAPAAKKSCTAATAAAAAPAAAAGESEAALEEAYEYASSCCIPTTWKEYPLVSVRPYNHDTSIFEFGLEEGQSLGLPVCGCILMATTPPSEGEGSDAEMEVRPYTPISDNSVLGKFELLIKRYPAWGNPSFPHNYKPPGARAMRMNNLVLWFAFDVLIWLPCICVPSLSGQIDIPLRISPGKQTLTNAAGLSQAR